YVSFKISPFNFKELCEFKKIKDRNEMENLFLDYMKWGGLPQTLIFEDEFSKKTYLQDVYNSILIKDITERFNIKDVDLLNRIINYILTPPSQTFSPGNLVKYFESDNRKISLETIYNYMDYIVKSFIISKAERYDVRGKRILTGKYKYYLTDLGFAQIFSEGKKEQLGGILENIIYNELISRGYNVTVGDVLGHEVDFVATRFEKKIYIQVAYILADDTVIKREFGVYDKINDHFPKYVISTDKYDFSQNGIIHMNVIDFLINEEI
ncbi:MAG: ATP-binding protein, partial [Bacilli bacterium]|nr:ATP-binding protein [Bacilli bacterium]